ncbi:carboxy terminal-processing peptidase [Ferrimonas balearica]|uniref:carboxy terminal-processing peptidase n=1 Tax=Ferrimonas balearica TaxID=44012 RepID=UPI001C94F343|nr:carboxy terminal-processing peptidase [Ferrimonas balearica]MBY5979769.1 carboxy terminal-processing peptidase [Ferrimonas balearica]
MMKKTLSALVAGVLLSTQAWALAPDITASDLPVLAQEAQHRVASKRVADLFTRSHYRKFDMDTAFSSDVFDRYLQQLDFNRSLLLAKDVARFEGQRDAFAKQVAEGDLTLAYEMNQLAMQRRYERLAYALTLLDTPIKFDVAGDKYHFDREEAPWATTTAELDELWRQRVKYDALNLALTGKEWPEIQEMLEKRYNNAIKRLTQTNSEDVFQSVMNAYAYTIEPHTSYLSPRNADRFQTEMNLSLEGIGAVLQMTDDYTVVRSLVTGGPADRQGELSPNDKIIGVGQEGKEVVDVIGWRLDDVVDLIKGPKDSKVTLQVLPAKGGNNARAKEIVIVRDKVRLEDRAVKSEVLEIEQGNGEARRIGVIEIPSFYMNISQDVAQQLIKLDAENVEGVVIDLRGNGGGALSEASLLTGLFIRQGPVVQIRDQRGRISVNGDNDGQVTYDGPLTVMVDRYSASASEIFAAAMQDYGRALIIGEQTFGKGTVQQHRGLGRIYDLYEKPMGNVTYTIAKFYRINGGSTQLEGVMPDLVFPSFAEHGEYGESQEKNPLPWDSIPSARYGRMGEVPDEMLAQLKQRHQARIQGELEFQLLDEDIARYRKDKDKGWISLVKAEREAESEAEDARELERINARRKAIGEAPIEDLAAAEDDTEVPDFLLDEAGAITLDMIDWTRLAKSKNS